MKARVIFAIAAALWLAPMSAIGADPATPVQTLQDELSKAWDEVGRQLQDWGTRWSEHFSSSGSERPLISLMLSHREQLGLSSDQVRGLERLRSDFQRESIRFEADLRIAEIDLNSLLTADPVELQKVEAKVREIERLKADFRLARIRTVEKGKALLTAEQRAKLNDVIGSPQYSRARP